MRELLCTLLLAGCYLSTEDGMSEVHLPIRGLYTDPSPHTAPNGALSEADNVVLREENEAGPRPGFKSDSTQGSGYDMIGFFPYDGDVLVARELSGTNALGWDSDHTFNVAGSPDWTSNRFSVAEARKNLYFTESVGVGKFTVGGATTFSDLVLRPPGAIAASGASGTTQADNTRVAYIAILKRKDANDVWRIGQPGPRLVFDNGSGGALDVTVTVYLSSSAAAGDTLDLYRTAAVANTVYPSLEYALVHRVELTSADVSNGYISHQDLTADNDRGEAAYFSPSREGAEGINFAPPECKSLALYRGSLFFGDTRSVQRIKLRWDEGGDVSGSATGIGFRSVSGTLTNGSANLTSATGTTGVVEGMAVADVQSGGALTDFAGSGIVTITGISGSTYTLSDNWNGTTGAVTLTIADTVRIEGSTNRYLVGGYAYWLVGTGNAGDGATAAYPHLRTTAAPDVHLYALGNAVVYDDAGLVETANTEVVIEELERDDSITYRVFATHGDEYYPALPEPYSGGSEQAASVGVAFDVDDRPNGIAWSKSDQPEHVRLSDFAYVGGEQHEVLRILATREALWIFKTDGLWRLSGFGAESGWRIDPFDPTLKLLCPRCAAEMDGVIYAWANKGFVSISDAGVQQLSDPAIGDLLGSIENSLGAGNLATRGAWVAANPRNDEVLLGVPDAASDDTSGAVYVWNTKTFAWTTWNNNWSAVVYDPTAKALRVGGDYGGGHSVTAWHYDLESTDGDWTDYADYEYTITVTDISGDTVTISAGSGWTPAVGDVITTDGESSERAIITSITSATVFDVHDGTALSVDTGVGYVAYASCLKWVDKTEGNPAGTRLYRTVTPAFQSQQGVYQYDVELTSSRSLTATSRTLSSPNSWDLTTATPPTSQRAHVGRTHARGTSLVPRVCITQAGSQWRLNGIGISSVPISDRVSR